ncbi:Polyadenylate-binding protein, cytoplasmic and nuclear [Thelohanellus kitauei]|uniref:Polyadenylate-binding protein, cytoplasmic and nuclear n=1 Tax=Thelohanellus kitauei TaxID=669202 RepID=A0A0C2MEL6_THEKT|nr:Polyadenylate-binding protein, cytoplasmic and nuclear [Thelohanellus kitauei]
MTQANETAAVSVTPHIPGAQIPNPTILPQTVGFTPVAPSVALGPNINIASLYVGELKPEVSEQLLWNIFSAYGQVLSVKVCRDSQTQTSLGYAYINFRTSQEAEKAMEAVNFSNIDGRPCRVMWSMRDSTRRKFGIGNLFIKNIDPDLDAKSLHQAFSSFGPVLSCKIALDEYGLSKGYGFVQFLNEADADLARERSNGVEFRNKVTVVNKFIPKAERKDAKPINPHEFTNLFVKNFGKDWSEDDLKKKFERFGEITSVCVRKNENNESMGYGFVNFAKHECAAAAAKDLNGSKIENGNEITVCRAMKLRERKAYLRRQYEERKRENFKKNQSLNLYVKNFDENVTDAKLSEIFQDFGEIKSAHVMKDDNNRSRCFGFVCFTKPEDAQKAIDSMHLKVYEGRPLYVAHAQSKEERRKTFEQQTLNNSFRGPMMAPPGGVQFVYPGAFPYAPQPQFSRFQQQGANRNQQRGAQHASNQPGQQYPQGIQRGYNNYQQGGNYQGSYRARGNNGGGMARSNPSTYQQRQHQPQNQAQPVQVTVNQVSTEGAPRSKREDVKVQPAKPQSDLRMEFNNKIFQICQNMFKQKNYDDEYLYRVSGIVVDYFSNDSSAHLNTKDADIVDALGHAYESVLADSRSKT